MASEESSVPVARYSIWQTVGAALSLSMRALEEVRALAKRPPPVPGKDADPAQVRAIVVAELEGYSEQIRNLVAAEVEEARKSLSLAKAAMPTSDELALLIETAVKSAMDALPRPKDGRDAKVDPEEITRIIEDRVDKAIAQLPPAEPGAPGKSIDPVDAARMVEEEVAKLPAAQPGREGPPGKFTAIKPWSKGIHYESALVTHEGSTYCALRDTADEPPHEDWALVAARGADAPIGEVYGLYEPTKHYRKFDWVTENGSRWQARIDDPGPLPGDGWAMAAKVGKPGRPGDPGPKGDPGVGKPGPPGPRITEWRKDGYRAIPVMSDGSTGPALDVREFFERYHGEAAG